MEQKSSCDGIAEQRRVAGQSYHSFAIRLEPTYQHGGVEAPNGENI